MPKPQVRPTTLPSKNIYMGDLGARQTHDGVTYEFVKTEAKSGKEVYTWMPLDPNLVYREAQALWMQLMMEN